MYYTEYATIQYEPIEVVHSKRKSESFDLRSCTIDELNKAIDKHVKSLKEKGMTLFRLEFSGSEDDLAVNVQGTRMETDEEMKERITRQEKHNERVREQRVDEKVKSDRRKELERLTKHLTLDQLKAIESIQL